MRARPAATPSYRLQRRLPRFIGLWLFSGILRRHMLVGLAAGGQIHGLPREVTVARQHLLARTFGFGISGISMTGP